MSLSAMKRATATSVVSLCIPGVQNGGCFSRCRGSNSVSALSMASPKVKTDDELDNYSDEPETIHRPTKPGRSAPVKGLLLENRFPQHTNDDGSLPCSPGSPTDCEKMLKYPSSGLERETLELIGKLFRIYSGQPVSEQKGNAALSTLKRVVDNIIEKHHIAYNGMLNKLDLSQQNDDMSFVTSVAKHTFSDGTTNWGRIASLIAFGAVVCRHLKESGQEQHVEDVANQISAYLLTEQQDWLLGNKAWEGFVEFFHVEDTESLVRNALMAVAGFASLGAGLAYFIR